MSQERPMEGEPATAPASVSSSRATSRRVLAGFFWLVASLSILVSSVTLWAHQSLLTSSGWTAIVSDVISDEEFVDAASTKIVRQLSDALGVQERVAQAVPGNLDVVAAAITTNVEDRIAHALADFAMRPQVQAAFLAANRAAHDAAMKTIRGPDSEALNSAEGTITLTVWPLIDGALQSLQDAGFIDASREIPDLSEYQPQAESVARLERILGRDLPDDFGTITLVQSDRLARVQTAVRNFDLITLATLLLAAAAVALALWLSMRRLRMVLWLAVGAVLALLLGRGFIRLVLEDVSGALSQPDGIIATRVAIESAVDSLMWFTFALIVVALIVAGLTLWAERREADGGGSGLEIEPRTVREWLRTRARIIGAVGIGLIAFAVIWNLGGPDVSLIAAAAVGVVLVAVSILARRDDEAATSTEAATVTDAEPGAGADAG